MLAVALGVATWILAAAPPAEAHALLRSSSPADGERLEEPPGQISLEFTERPAVDLTRVEVIDAEGDPVPTGPPVATSDDGLVLTVSVGISARGAYTVVWRTVSAVDGHPSSGAFAFGIGVEAGPAASVESPEARPSWPAVAGRWLLYAGVFALIGSAVTALWVMPSAAGRLASLLPIGVAAAAIGVGLVLFALVSGSGASVSTVLGTPPGRAVVARAAGVVVAALGAGLAAFSPPRARVGLWLALAGGVIVTIAHAMQSHAGAGGAVSLEVAAQAVHMTAGAVWLGGLATLLVATRGTPSHGKAHAVRRFSSVAGIALGVVVLTGLIRAIDEVEGWSELFGTLFGRLVVVKVVLLGVLAALGAANRYRNVAAAERSLRGLRRVGRTEIAVAAIVLATTAVLSQLVPPATTGSASATGVTVTGSDFAQTVRARLTLTPGTPGTNLFTVQLEDHHTGAPIEASRVQLTLRMPSRPDIPPGTVRLTREDPGTYRATAADVAVAGDWLITVVVGDGTEVTDVELTVPIHPSGSDEHTDHEGH